MKPHLMIVPGAGRTLVLAACAPDKGLARSRTLVLLPACGKLRWRTIQSFAETVENAA